MALKVLLVDDQLHAIHLLSMLLGVNGCETRGVTQGEEALRVAADWRPHAICVDLDMPVMNGYELTSRLRKIEAAANVRIVAVSSSTADQELLESAGIDLHVLKPVSIYELRRALLQPLAHSTAVN